MGPREFNAIADRQKHIRRDKAYWVSILCQVQGAKVTADDLTGEGEEKRRKEEKRHHREAMKLLKDVKAGKVKVGEPGRPLSFHELVEVEQQQKIAKS